MMQMPWRVRMQQAARYLPLPPAPSVTLLRRI